MNGAGGYLKSFHNQVSKHILAACLKFFELISICLKPTERWRLPMFDWSRSQVARDFDLVETLMFYFFSMHASPFI